MPSALLTQQKVMGYRQIPLTPELIHKYAKDIAGESVGEKLDLPISPTSSRSQDAQGFYVGSQPRSGTNVNIVAEFHELLGSISREYNISPENIYNADEKGVLLGIGHSITALFDRNQKNLQHIIDGNCELVTVMETVCADGTALPPSVIFKGKRLDTEWGRDNPGNARFVLMLHIGYV
jgi:hypothetical protein